MPHCDVYISNWEDAIQAAKDDMDIGTPQRRSPFIGNGRAAWDLYHEWAKQGRIHCTQTDWAGWVAKVSGEEILVFVKQILSETSTLDMSHLKQQVSEVRDFAESLDPETEYALVATEL